MCVVHAPRPAGAGRRALAGEACGAIWTRRQRGFTLLELIAVIVIAGVLLAVAGPRFFSAAPFAARGYADAAAAFLRHAQKLAIARQRQVFVHLGAGGLLLCAAPSLPCAPLPGPDGESPHSLTLPSGVTQHPATAVVGFDALGRPTTGLTLQVSAGGDSHTVTVEAETGYVR